MPFIIKRADITKIKADIIVNTANPNPVIGAGTDYAIYEAAGAEKLLAERKKIGTIERGDFAITSAYNLQARYIYHTVGPVWEDGKQGEIELLAGCYQKCIEQAVKTGMRSIAFPLISSGVYGFPKDVAITTAIHAITDMVIKHPIMVFLIIFSDESLGAARKFFPEIEEEIDGISVEAMLSAEYALNAFANSSGISGQELALIGRRRQNLNLPVPSLKAGSYDPSSLIHEMITDEELNEMMAKMDKPFNQRLLTLLGTLEDCTSSEFADKRAHITKQHLSKLTKKDSHPSKKVVFALCVAFRLNRMESLKLLNSAGYGIDPSNLQDIVFWKMARYPMSESYTVDKINIFLSDHGIDIIGTF